MEDPAIAMVWCEPTCDGSLHPRAVCRTWSPFRHRRPVGWRDVCEAAALPVERVGSLWRRFADERLFGPGRGRSWLLSLVYAMLLDEEPELAPDAQRLRAAVEARDHAAVDALMQPLDRAAVVLVGAEPDRWWNEVHPRLAAFAGRALDHPAAEQDASTWNVTVLEYEHDVARLVKRWNEAYRERWNSDGYMETASILWHVMQSPLDAVLLAQCGGHAPGAHVDVDGRRMVIASPVWGPAGPPIAYYAWPAGETGHGSSDPERVDAAACQSIGA